MPISEKELAEWKSRCQNTLHSDAVIGMMARIVIPRLIEEVEILREAVEFAAGEFNHLNSDCWGEEDYEAERLSAKLSEKKMRDALGTEPKGSA